MVSIRYMAPAPALRTHISSYYWFEADVPVVDDLIRAELGQVRFLPLGYADYHFADGRVVPVPRAQLAGPTTAPIRFLGRGPMQVFGAGLMPAGWSALIGESADVLADQVIDLECLFGPGARQCLETIACARSDDARAAAADCFFLGLEERATAVPMWFTRLTDDWLIGSRDPTVDDLFAASGMSARSIERLSKRIYGASPKYLSRKYRALQAAVRISNGDAHGWADFAAAGFYDQAHFIREFRTFVGITPSRFARELAPLNRLTILERKKLPSLPRLALYS